MVSRSIPMSGPNMESHGDTGSRARRRGGARFVPTLGALTLVGLSLYASQKPSQPAAKPDQPAQARGGQAQARVAAAVTAANKFLEALDAGQRAKALLAFDSPKKSGWSN